MVVYVSVLVMCGVSVDVLVVNIVLMVHLVSVVVLVVHSVIVSHGFRTMAMVVLLTAS